MELNRLLLLTAGLTATVAALAATPDRSGGRIEPYEKNPHYWQYRGQPVMLLGGSKTDHIFLLDDLETHLDAMREVGANYVRNTMSQREGKELKPHLLLPAGKFDLDQWNPEYWARFENMLRWTAAREIFVQIEVWDRFDYSTQSWEHSPWNPGNNVNYTYEQIGFAETYPQHSSRDLQPFFHSIEGMPRYHPKLDRIRRYQEAFVAKMLSYSLDYGHVLYCMDNETSTPAAWGQYWIQFIKAGAADRGVTVCVTDMFDDAKASIKAARLVERSVKFWDVTPQMDLLSGRESNEAYLAAKPGEAYVLYFTNGGSVELDLTDAAGPFAVTWISVSMGISTRTSAAGGYRLMQTTLTGARVVTLSAPYKGGWVAVLVKQ